MPAGQQVALEPALAEVLGEHLHHPAVGRDVVVVGRRASIRQRSSTSKTAPSRLRVGLVGAEEAEVRGRRGWRRRRRAAARRARRVDSVRSRARALDRERVAATGRGRRAATQPPAAVGVGRRAHPLVARRAPARRAPRPAARRRRSAPRAGRSASTPPASPGARGSRGPGRAAPGGRGRCPRSGRRRPPPGRSSPSACAARSPASAAAPTRRRRAPRAWISRIRRAALGERRGEVAVDRARVVAGDEVRPRSRGRASSAAISVLARPAEHGRAGDLVLVEVQDRQHGAVAGRVEEADALPGALERAGLGLAVADDAGDQQVGVVEGGAEGVDERVAELAALVDRARGRHADVARDPARGRELADQRAAARPRRRRPRDRSRSRCPRGRRWRRAPGRRDRGRRRRGRRRRSRRISRLSWA